MSGQGTMTLREKGNELFRKKDYNGAVLAYSAALGENPNDMTILSNRAEAFLQMELWQEAYVDVREVVSSNGEDVKGRYRLARALRGLGRLPEAVEHLVAAHEIDPTNEKVSDELRRIRRRLFNGEQAKAKKLLRSVLQDGKKSRFLRSDEPEFIGPVRVSQSWQSKGRCLLMTGDVPAGTILMGCRAAEIVYTAELDEFSPLWKRLERIQKTTDELERRLRVKVDSDTAFEQDLADLHAGGGIRVPLDDNSRSNGQEATGEREEQKELQRQSTPEWTDRQAGKPPNDKLSEWIGSLVRYNALTTTPWDPLPADPVVQFEEDEHQEAPSQYSQSFAVGIWLLPSFVNHSCLFNTFRFIIGNFLFMVATRPLEIGDEVTTFYVRPDEPNRRKVLKGDYSFDCKCALCRGEDKMSKTARGLLQKAAADYDKLTRRIGYYDRMCLPDLRAAIMLVRQADSMLRIRPNRQLCDFLLSLVLIYTHYQWWQKAADALSEAFAALAGDSPEQEEGDVAEIGGGSASPEPLMVDICMQLSCALSRCEKPQEARDWLERGRRFARYMYAEDNVVEECFGVGLQGAADLLQEAIHKEKAKQDRLAS